MPRVISIHSYRGGTGKSNFAANLATTVALLGYRVGVVDTDLPSPGIHTLFDLEPEDMDKTLNHYLWGNAPIEAAAYDVSARIGMEAQGNKGTLFFVPSSVRVDDITRILQEGYDVAVLKEGLRQLVKELNLDFLFIDTHPGLSRETFMSIALSHVLILILRPDKQDYQGTAVVVDLVRELNARRILLAINKVHSQINPEVLKQKVEETYNAPVSGILPFSEDMLKLASEGVFCVKYPDHPVSQQLYQIAIDLMA
jgi:MinD-like ATPase involved in chromosome partitioning or flagellar assembly